MKKIGSFLLSVLVLFGIVANDMSLVSAMNAEKVTLTSEKEEIEINEKTNLTAEAVFPETVEIVDYSWISDDEAVAIVSGEENVATVTGMGAGKTKITVTVNYKNKDITETQENEKVTAEIEITVVDNETEKNAVKAQEDADIETSDSVLDPETAEYIKKNINTDYARAEMIRLDQVLVVKNTLVEASGLDDNETIDSFFLREDAGDLFITTIPAHVALYNTDESSDYYVGFANTMFNDKTAEIKDWIFAYNNNNGEVIKDGCYFDKETGLAYISKNLFGDVAGNVQVQFMQAVNQTAKKLKSKVRYAIDENNIVKTGEGQVSGFSFETSVQAEKGLTKSEMLVSVNGLPVSNFEYDKDTGIVTIAQSSTAIQSINVEVNKKSVLSKLAYGLLNISDVEAFSIAEMGCAGTVDVPDGVNTGWKGQVSLYKAYASSWGSATLPVYGLTSGESSLMTLIYNGGSLDYNKLNSQNTAMYLGIWIQGGLDTTTGIWHNSFWNWSAENVTGATQLDAWLRLQCTHLSNPDTGKGVEWKDELINVRVLDKTGDEIVVGFLTKRVNSQSGAGIAKFKIRQKKGNLSITKVNGNPSLTADNDCYSLAGAEYQLRSGNTTVATLTTDANGNATATGINAGTYTLVETKASSGFELNTEHTSVTINAGQTTTLNGVGCLVEQPANDPVAIQITKADMDSAESNPQGNASLEGAEFTVKYYNALYDKVYDLPEKATRTWVLKTKKQSNGTYKALMLDSYKVSGDDFYREYGIVTLPIGTITIQETKAPDGYLLDGATLVDGNGSIENIDNGIYLTQIIQNDTNGQAQVTAGNFPVVKDEVKKHKVEIEKVSQDHDGNNAVLADATFTIKLKSEIAEKGWDASAVYDEVTTDKNGSAVTKELPYGTYILSETKTPEGYVKADDIEFTINKDISETSKIQHITVTDQENHIKLYKYDIETDAPLRRAEYLVYNVTKDKEVGRYQTDFSGIIDLYKLDNSCVYYVQEVNAPNGYEINNSKFYFEFDSNGYVRSDMNASDIDRSVFLVNDKGDMTISLSNKLKWFKLNINKLNDADYRLAGAEFTLYKDEECTQEVAKGTTDDEGNLMFDKVEVGTYYLKETKAPAGYRKLLDPIKIAFKCENKEHTFYVNDVSVKNAIGNYSMTVENDWYVGNMTIVNQRGSKLPETGSSAMIMLSGAGIALCLLGLKSKRKKENMNEGE